MKGNRCGKAEKDPKDGKKGTCNSYLNENF